VVTAGVTGKFAPLALVPTATPPDGTVYHVIVLPADVPTKLEDDPTQIVAGVAVTGVGAAGEAVTVKMPALVAVPPAVVTAMFPVAALLGIAVICVALFTTKDNALVPPKVTADAPVKLVPVITTETACPHPEAGVNDAIVGGGAFIVIVTLRQLACVPQTLFVFQCM
jgi:hypothetical protein